MEQRIQERCAALGYEARITASKDLSSLILIAQKALEQGVESMVVGGGDGTLSQIAGLLVKAEIPLGVLPLGTFNHFARDLGIPLPLEEALGVALTGRVERCDVGEVNGRVFLNNSSLGLYPLIVRLRAQHPVRGPAKWAVAAWATLREIRHGREIAVLVNSDAGVVVRRTPIVFIGNNEYRAEGLDLGTRASLHDGILSIYIVKSGGKRHLLRLAWRMLTRRVEDQELEVLLVEEATLETGATRLQLAIDGDVEQLTTPLRYRIRPAALRVRVPPASVPSDDAPPPDRRYRPTTTTPPP
jgi:diacylglycerol kinase family enzyme